MSTNRFHKASKDGKLEVLKEATRGDCNARDEQGMTPTLYAAFHGHLEALRLLCGRAGDPDKADIFGGTALHLAAAQGHKHIVTFLVNFGANIYATDIDGRTAQELAGINGRDDILRYLDGATAKLEATDKKKAKSMKEKAKEDAKKRIKEFNKKKNKEEQMNEKLEKRTQTTHRPSMMETLRARIGGSTSNLANTHAAPRTSFSAIVGGTMTGTRKLGMVERKILQSKNNRMAQIEDDFKISEIEDGKKSVRSLRGVRRDSEVLLGGTLDYRRGRLDGVFNEAEQVQSGAPPPPPSGTLFRSMSQPDFMHDLQNNADRPINKEPASIFVRPGMGSIVIRKSISNAFGSYYSGPTEESSIGSGESYGARTNVDDYQVDESDSSDDENPNGPLERFLTVFGLSEYLPRFEEQKIDLDSLMMLTENDFKSLNLPLGPNRKLINAVNERKAALENPGKVTDSQL